MPNIVDLTGALEAKREDDLARYVACCIDEALDRVAGFAVAQMWPIGTRQRIAVTLRTFADAVDKPDEPA